MDQKEVIATALREIQEEVFRVAVNLEKERRRRPWWKKVFPWRVRLVIERR